MTGYMEGELKDWPPHIQDAIYAAMERVIKKTRVKGLVMSGHVIVHCGRD